jgi:hypothetical protein
MILIIQSRHHFERLSQKGIADGIFEPAGTREAPEGTQGDEL